MKVKTKVTRIFKMVTVKDCTFSTFLSNITRSRSAVGNVSATDASLTADPGVASSILAPSYTFVEIDHEIISTVILLPSAESFKKGCCVNYNRKYVHEVLVNCLFKLAQEKV